MKLVVLGLSITSAWGNGHASTYRSLLRALSRRGHEILFLERDTPWYAPNRDLPAPEFARVAIYDRTDALATEYAADLAEADVVVVGSYVPEGSRVIESVFRHARGVRAFYDIDTPVTLQTLETGDAAYITREQIPKFDLYLSFSGGPVLSRLERRYHAQRARALYCSIEAPDEPIAGHDERWHLGYLGTYSADRQPGLDMRLLEPARRWHRGRFVVAGAQFPSTTEWPDNVDWLEHVPPTEHARFYAAQRYTLNLTRQAMVDAGYSPSVRLFEAAAFGVPIISDDWPGLDSFFVPGEEILVSHSTRETLACLIDLPEAKRRHIAEQARRRVLARHTAAHRAAEFEGCVAECS